MMTMTRVDGQFLQARERAAHLVPGWGLRTGSSVTAYPLARRAQVAIASRVRTVARAWPALKVMTPMVRNSPRLRARAALLGR